MAGEHAVPEQAGEKLHGDKLEHLLAQPPGETPDSSTDANPSHIKSHGTVSHVAGTSEANRDGEQSGKSEAAGATR